MGAPIMSAIHQLVGGYMCPHTVQAIHCIVSHSLHCEPSTSHHAWDTPPHPPLCTETHCGTLDSHQ